MQLVLRKTIYKHLNLDHDERTAEQTLSILEALPASQGRLKIMTTNLIKQSLQMNQSNKNTILYGVAAIAEVKKVICVTLHYR